MPPDAAKVIIVYSGRQAASVPVQGNGRMLSIAVKAFPCMVSVPFLRTMNLRCSSTQESGKAAGYKENPGGTVIARIGYDLFPEVRFLLDEGQPVANAGIPTLELHIAVLRDLIVENWRFPGRIRQRLQVTGSSLA